MKKVATAASLTFLIVFLASGGIVLAQTEASAPTGEPAPSASADESVPPAPASEPAAAEPTEHGASAEPPGGSHAAEPSGHGEAGPAEEHHGFPVGQVVAAVVNFVLFAGILVWVSKKAVKQFYQKRSEELMAAIKKAEAALTEAKAIEEAARVRLDQASQEAEKIMENAKELAGRHSHELVESARKQAERILTDSQATIQAETKKLTDDLLQDLSERVVEIARKKLQEKVDPGAQRGLINDYLNKVGEV